MKMTMPSPKYIKDNKMGAYLKRYFAKCKRVLNAIDSRNRKGPEMVSFAKPAVLKQPRATTITYIPDYLEPSTSTPEEKAEKSLDIENVIDIDPEVLDSLRESSEDLTTEIKRILLNEGASMLISFDDASSFSEVALRDGMGIEVEIDSSINKGIAQLIRLNVIHACLKKTTLPNEIKSQFMRVFTNKLALDTLEAMQKSTTSEKYSSLLRNLQARVNGKYSENVGHSSPVGVVKKRSTPSYAPGDNASSPQIHQYNEEQNKGVRFSNSG